MLILSTIDTLSHSVSYTPAPWFMQWFEKLSVFGSILVLCVAGFMWLLKKPVEELAGKLFELALEKLRHSGKHPVSSVELARKAQKAVRLEQGAEALRLQIVCDHVEVYGCQNGEYLRSGEGIDKFVMQAEAVKGGQQRYMDLERILFAQDIPRTIMALEEQQYLLLWDERCDDWKMNKIMKERFYKSTIAVFLTRPIQPTSKEVGIIGMFLISWSETEIYRVDQADSLPKKHIGPTRFIDTSMVEIIKAYAAQFSYIM